MLKAILLTAILFAPAVLASQTEIAPAPTGTETPTTSTTTEPSIGTLKLVEFPDPIDVTFDSNGVPILGDMDPTKVPIRGLGILERVARAKQLAADKAAKLAGGPETITVTTGTA